MVLILLDEPISSRLSYCLDFVFKESLGLAYQCTHSIAEYKEWEGIKLAYLAEIQEMGGLIIKKNIFIDQKHTQLPKNLSIHRWKKTLIFFYNQPGKSIPFDLFSAIFLLLSRIEEYGSTDLDEHQRYDPKKSLAYQYSFLEEPIIDIWIAALRQLLVQHFNISIPLNPIPPTITIDIDFLSKYGSMSKIKYWFNIIYYRLKGQKEVLQLMRSVRKGSSIDPYESIWEAIIDNSSPLLSFILLSEGHSYDTNNSLDTYNYPQWLHVYKNRLNLQLHPSYRGHKQIDAWKKEQSFLAINTQQKIDKSRFHYMKYTFPDSFHRLQEMNITDDYSMGYGRVNGYRASTSRSFKWYDLSKEEVTTLRIHPFVFMDSAAFFHSKQTVSEHWIFLQKQYQWSLLHGTPMMVIFHNYLLSDQKDYLQLFRDFKALIH